MDQPDAKPEETSAGATAEFVARVGGEVRRRRKKQGLTVQQLADLSGVSRRMLTLIEQGQANPSLVTIDKIARALGTDFASLASDSRPEPVAVHAPGAAAGVWSSSAGSRASLQVATQQIPAAELWDWYLVPGDRYDALPDAPGSEELFFVTEGVLTLAVAGHEPVQIATGGSARLASDRRYAYVNNEATAVRFIRVVRLA